MPTFSLSERFAALEEATPEHQTRWTGDGPPGPSGRGRFGLRRTRRRTRRLVVGTALALSILLIMALAVPLLDGPLTAVISDRIASQVACPGALAKPPKITIKGGRLLPQALRRRLTEIELVLPDASIGGVDHASFAATLRDVSQPTPETTHVGSIDASITIGFANMPSLPDVPRPTFGRAPDKLLTVATTPPADVAKNVKATLLAKLELDGETMKVVPQRLLIFGKAVPAARAESQTGGVRTERLPDLPDGLTYRSIAPKSDGLHVALGGVVTTPFSELPPEVDGQSVSYTAKEGMLGISTSKNLPLIGDIPLTIFASPRIDKGELTLVPQSVEILGSVRGPDDPIAALVLSQIKQESLARKLPDLPSGVKYRSVSVDSSGIKVVINGVTVTPFSDLPAKVGGRPTAYGARDGLLAVTSKGTSTDRSMSIVLHAKPVIVGSVLDLAPQRIEMFGVMFPARDVLATIKTDLTKYPLQALPTNLAYRGVEVLADGLRITLSGENVTMDQGALGGASC